MADLFWGITMTGITNFWPDLLMVFGAFALAVGSPGPSNLSIMGTSMHEGRVTGLVLAAGVSLGSITWGLLATAGVTSLLAQYPQALWAIQIAGALYLLYLGFRSARAALGPDLAPLGASPVTSDRLRATLLRGILMHLTNPKAILTWTAIIALGLRPDMPGSVVGVMLMGCFAISLILNSTYAIVFSTPALIAGYRQIRRPAEWALSGFFAVAGLSC
jgi:threonine efflux protein